MQFNKSSNHICTVINDNSSLTKIVFVGYCNVLYINKIERYLALLALHSLKRKKKLFFNLKT